MIFVYAVFFAILLVNFFFYIAMYRKQQDYVVSLLNRQVQIVGVEVDSTNNFFMSDLNKICNSEDLATFFTDPESKATAEEKMKLFYSKYQDFVTGIKLFDKSRNEYTLKKDGETWLPQNFILHVQGQLADREQLVRINRSYDYYLPVIQNTATIANLVVSVDYQKYFNELFSAFNLEDYQWQWVVSDSGEILFTNSSVVRR